MRLVMLSAMAALALGCRYRPEPVPVLGVHLDIELLSGDWDGEYSNPDSHRGGSIFFRITSHGDSAFGDVLMRVPANEVAPRPVDLLTGHEQHAQSAELLSISFVRVADGNVQGELEPYIAPDCGCVARTTFYGRVAGDVIQGSFVTTTAGGPPQRGDWWVRRALPLVPQSP
jgi:hypothetical protein